MRILSLPDPSDVSGEDAIIGWDDTNTYRIPVADLYEYLVGAISGGALHRRRFRGKKLGTTVSATQWTTIRNGAFTDIYLGDWWYISGERYFVADMDYWGNWWDYASTAYNPTIPSSAGYAHHLILVWQQAGHGVMNYNNSAFYGSNMYDILKGTTNTMEGTNLLSTVRSAFGDTHLRGMGVSDLGTAAFVHEIRYLELPTEIQIYGTPILGQNLIGNVEAGTRVALDPDLFGQQFQIYKQTRDDLWYISQGWTKTPSASATYTSIPTDNYWVYVDWNGNVQECPGTGSQIISPYLTIR